MCCPSALSPVLPSSLLPGPIATKPPGLPGNSTCNACSIIISSRLTKFSRRYFRRYVNLFCAATGLILTLSFNTHNNEKSLPERSKTFSGRLLNFMQSSRNWLQDLLWDLGSCRFDSAPVLCSLFARAVALEALQLDGYPWFCLQIKIFANSFAGVLRYHEKAGMFCKICSG